MSTPRSEALRERHLIRTYGVTSADYDRMYDVQLGACWICSKRLPKRALGQGRGPSRVLNVDHADVYGKPVPIALLCLGCNTAIGSLGHSVPMLERVRAYLVMRQAVTNRARMAAISSKTRWPEWRTADASLDSSMSPEKLEVAA